MYMQAPPADSRMVECIYIGRVPILCAGVCSAYRSATDRTLDAAPARQLSLKNGKVATPISDGVLCQPLSRRSQIEQGDQPLGLKWLFRYSPLGPNYDAHHDLKTVNSSTEG